MSSQQLRWACRNDSRASLRNASANSADSGQPLKCAARNARGSGRLA
jgi:hypothetical protein